MDGGPAYAAEAEAAPPPEALAGRPSRPGRPPSIQRERRDLMRQREVEIRDVGGLALEMARRDAWNPDLLAARTSEVLAIEARIAELDSMLVAAEAAARGIGAERCVCGAPIVRGTHFCSHCGRPATETPPVVACSHCGQGLPADSNFCPVCGNGVAAEEYSSKDPIGSTLIEPITPREDHVGDP
ncbi:MAG: zinc ribbon domain-containing protein [Actinomycetota bacterium]|nr:zinc ribbon domain-containing protein [Actinomycetota bacterium]